MNQGASACAGGLPGACNVLFPPDFMWPGIFLLVVVLGGIWLLHKKKLLKMSFKPAFLVWLVVAICFGIVVALQTETGYSRMRNNEEVCNAVRTTNPACEY